MIEKEPSVRKRHVNNAELFFNYFINLIVFSLSLSKLLIKIDKNYLNPQTKFFLGKIK